jgi:hypothetical protein
MATIPLSQLILDDRWPGQPSILLGRPTSGWDNTVDNFTSTATDTQPNYPLGTKIVAYTDNTWCAGWYTMMYLSFHDYSGQDITADISTGAFYCSHYDGSDAEYYMIDESACPYYIVSRCYTSANTDATRGMPIAIPCATLASDGSAVYATGYGDAYGWFWVGGVCPCGDATRLQGAVGDLAGADITVTATQRGPVYADMDGTAAYLTLRSMGDATDLVNIPYPPVGYACVTAA